MKKFIPKKDYLDALQVVNNYHIQQGNFIITKTDFYDWFNYIQPIGLKSNNISPQLYWLLDELYKEKKFKYIQDVTIDLLKSKKYVSKKLIREFCDILNIDVPLKYI